ncbi:hypothetical protein BJ138DRAFT_1091111 [Hygrophoropsis aurantiaca]|uniref:Uncharacterized protein n=1 Tax=Hygrophoropsis aurantiaca TaxID=72124 RepID=A0ACB8A645_9AGAM|nr:hypothetical protein BJ138DRAFT_1091111 [Hygrophoropsis aurantiaca]
MAGLPANDYTTGRWRDAYDRCLVFEKNAASVPPPLSGPSRLVCARLLGYIIREALTDCGRDTISNEIKDCADEDALVVLATLYLNYFIRCFLARKKVRTPTPSQHPSRPSFHDVQETLKYLINEAPQSHATAKQKALYRDGFCCVLSGACDAPSFESIASVRDLPLASDKEVAPTHAAHILPESAITGILGANEGDAKLNLIIATVWTIMERFGQVLIPDELNGPNIHHLENVMTLSTPNHYRPNSAYPQVRSGIPDLISFTTPDPVQFPLPSPEYLRLHAACARVHHFSGAAEYIRAVLRDMDDVRVLASDGASADALHFSLLNLEVQ